MQAITAQAGLNIRTWEWDDGIDMEIGSAKPIDGVRIPGLAVPIQVKSTQNWEIRNATISYSLKASNYNRLREECLWPQYLVLYTLPAEPTQWITHEDDHCKLSHVAYYLNLGGQPELVSNEDGTMPTTKTVHIPIANRLTAQALFDLFEHACESARALRSTNV